MMTVSFSYPMRLTLSSLVRTVLLESEEKDGLFDHPLHDRAHRIAQRLEDPSELLAAASPALVIGKGANASVYQIPGEDDLVLRVSRSKFVPLPSGELTAVRVTNPYGDMNVGQPLASVGNASVHLMQRGEPAGMTLSEPAFKNEDRDEVYRARIELAADMPRDAYNRVAGDLLRVNEAGFQWDPSKSNNILIDGPSGSFGLVDTSPRMNKKYFNSASDLIICLVGNTHAWRASEMEAALRPARKKIVMRVLAAARSVGLPISSYEKGPRDDSSLEYSMKLAGVTFDEMGL